MNHTPYEINEQLQRLYLDQYVPWARNQGIEPITYENYRERVMEHCAQHIMDTQDQAGIRQRIMNHWQGQGYQQTGISVPQTTNPGMTVTTAETHSPMVMASFYVADRVSKKTMADPNFIGGPHNPEESEMRRCMQCGFNVWVDKKQLDEAEKSEGILCIDCIPEMTGMSREEFHRQVRFK